MNLQMPPAFIDNEEHYQSTTIINEPSNVPKPASTKDQFSTPKSQLFTASSSSPKQQRPPSATQISFRTVLFSNGFNQRSRNYAEEPRPEEVTNSNLYNNISVDIGQESMSTGSPPTTRQSRRLMIDLSDMSLEQDRVQWSEFDSVCDDVWVCDDIWT